jgi:hypothetical protein
MVTVSEVKRNCVRATERGEEAWRRSRDRMEKNRIEDAARQRAGSRKALVSKAALNDPC